MLDVPGGEPQVLKLAKASADNSRGDDSAVHHAIDDNDQWVAKTKQGRGQFLRRGTFAL